MNSLSTEEKYSFLVWILKNNIQEKLNEMNKMVSQIENDPSGSWYKLHLAKEDLEAELVRLNYVGKRDERNINSFYDHYKNHYADFLNQSH